MPIGLTPNFKWDYVLECERNLDFDNQTVFKLKSLTGAQSLSMLSYTTGQKYTSSVIMGLIGWENFKDKEGNDIEFKKEREGQCHKDNLDYLEFDHLAEIANAIFDRNVITGDEEKN